MHPRRLLTLPRTRSRLRACGSIAALALLLVAASPEDTDLRTFMREGKSLYGQKKQELIIRHFFKDRRDGFYVDIGCYHPIKASTTFYLEKHLGWRGIGVDALEYFEPLWEKHRPESKFFAYAVTDQSGETITFYAAGPISSIEVENIERWEKVRGKPIQEREIKVPTITIDDLLGREGVEKIDFFSIDINGTEPTAMAGFDIQRFRPELVHIEVHKKNREVLSAYFEKNGYRRLDEYLPYDRSNWYFTPKEPAGDAAGSPAPTGPAGTAAEAGRASSPR
jgi:FkbM family methyltransferase